MPAHRKYLYNFGETKYAYPAFSSQIIWNIQLLDAPMKIEFKKNKCILA
ncbi:MAG: hypothetical protein ACFFBD_04955 [Candidatus Hodarchaeota archaeon]